ncbi:MAG: hypothetical protein RL115_1719 [Bacteroidota bacterium]|jgi:Ca-activated chloride channel family protein
MGIPVLIICYFLYARWHQQAIQKIGDPFLVQKLFNRFSFSKMRIQLLLLLLAFTMGVVAVLNPRKPGNGETIKKRGLDVVFALDISNSMLAADVAPSRLALGKKFISDYLKASPNDRVALVVFAGRAYLQMPLTSDHAAANLMLSAASPNSILQQGTDISEALAMSANAFSVINNHHKAVVLITDGEGHDEEALEKAKKLATQAVLINCVGIGYTQGSPLLSGLPGTFKKDAAGNVILSKLNDQLLKEIAASTNGTYIHLQKVDEGVRQLQQQMKQIDTKNLIDTNHISYQNYFPWFAAFMLLLLIASLFISGNTKGITAKMVYV